MHRSIVPLAASLAPLVLAACASAGEPPPAAPTRTALDTLRAGADFAFSLDESDPAAQLRAQCAAQHPGDAAASDSCYAQIRDEAAHEGLRFAVDPQGRLVWTSYGRENGADVVYIEGAMDAQAESDRVVAAKFCDVPHGTTVPAKVVQHPDMTLRFQLVDDHTLEMVDPHKGKLVFHRVH
jgi:hypothetical protein